MAKVKKPRVGYDFDGLLLDTYRAMIRIGNRSIRNHGLGLALPRYSYDGYPSLIAFNDSIYLPSLCQVEFDHFDDVLFRAPTGIYASQPIHGVVEDVRQTSQLAKLFVVTGGIEWQEELKLAYVAAHFPQIKPKRVIFTGDGKNQYPDKATACQAKGITILHEDRYDLAVGCADAGIDVILHLRYAWSFGPPHPRIHRVASTAQGTSTMYWLLSR